VSSFGSELRACLSEILRGSVPEAAEDDHPVRFFEQWLAERNLGLVPIDNAAAFNWPGQWIAAFRDDDGEHALVMFGSPSGIWLDPSNAYHQGTRIEAGWMLTPLDLYLSTERPYGATTAPGTVAAILTTANAEEPLNRVGEAEALAGRGLAGDRYAAGRGTFSGRGRGYELTLAEAEVLGCRLAEPCAHLEKLARPGLLRPLVHRGGLRADIIQGGVIRLGDEIEAIQ
jgi:hypothetical protein